MPEERKSRPRVLPENPYMQGDNWTVRRGWTIAMKKAIFRTGIGFIVTTGALYLVWGYTQAMPQHPALLICAFGTGGAVGLPMGYLVARKLPEASGLSGRSIMLPVLVMLAGITFAAYRLVAAVMGEGEMLTFAIGISIGIWSVLMAFRGLVLS